MIWIIFFYSIFYFFKLFFYFIKNTIVIIPIKTDFL